MSTPKEAIAVELDIAPERVFVVSASSLTHLLNHAATLVSYIEAHEAELKRVSNNQLRSALEEFRAGARLAGFAMFVVNVEKEGADE